MRQTDKKHPDSFYCMISQNVVNQNMQMHSISSYTYKKKNKKKNKKHIYIYIYWCRITRKLLVNFTNNNKNKKHFDLNMIFKEESWMGNNYRLYKDY